MADVTEVLSDEKDNNIDAIITISAWNGYTKQAQDYSESQGVGLFKLQEFMGALNYDGPEFIKYRPKKKRYAE